MFFNNKKKYNIHRYRSTKHKRWTNIQLQSELKIRCSVVNRKENRKNTFGRSYNMNYRVALILKKNLQLISRWSIVLILADILLLLTRHVTSLCRSDLVRFFIINSLHVLNISSFTDFYLFCLIGQESYYCVGEGWGRLDQETRFIAFKLKFFFFYY